MWTWNGTLAVSFNLTRDAMAKSRGTPIKILGKSSSFERLNKILKNIQTPKSAWGRIKLADCWPPNKMIVIFNNSAAHKVNSGFELRCFYYSLELTDGIFSCGSTRSDYKKGARYKLASDSFLDLRNVVWASIHSNGLVFFYNFELA